MLSNLIRSGGEQSRELGDGVEDGFVCGAVRSWVRKRRIGRMEFLVADYSGSADVSFTEVAVATCSLELLFLLFSLGNSKREG